jgi:hypothetical protein
VVYRAIETVRTKDRGTETTLKGIIPTSTLTLAYLANTEVKRNATVTGTEIVEETR